MSTLRLYHPKVYGSSRDKAAHRAQLEAQLGPLFGMMKKGQLTISCALPRPPKFVDGKVHEFAIVPVEVTHQRPGAVQRVEFTTIAVRKRGSGTFLFLRDATPGRLRQMFPDYPLTILPAP